MSLSISREYKSPNFNRRENIKLLDTIIIHYTGMKNAELALNYLCNKKSKVSAHYFINEDGKIWQIVDDVNTAWHAGVSKWLNRKNLNDTSIGIELVNPGHEHGYKIFNINQYNSLEKLIAVLIKKYDIKKDRVLAHSDISPSRKLDPGEKFDWRRLAKKDLAVWPNEILNIHKGLNSDQLLYNLLFKIGYDVKNHFKPSLVAFKRHFIQNDIDEDESELVINIAYSVYKAFIKVRSLY
jgi:N-acetylmuramoyl-L-alanine amidase